MLTSGKGDFRKGGRHGAGAKAFAEKRQVYFDTTEIGKTAMIAHAKTMVEEALAQQSGNYNSVTDLFVKPA